MSSRMLRVACLGLCMGVLFAAVSAQTGTWSGWHACSTPCGTGFTYRDCLNATNAIVDSSLCPGNATAPCNTQDCPIDTSTGSAPIGSTADFVSSTADAASSTADVVSSTADAVSSTAAASSTAGSSTADGSPSSSAVADSSSSSSAVADSSSSSSAADASSSSSAADVSSSSSAADVSSSSSAAASSTADIDVPVIGVWSGWHACSVSCGSGTTYRDCLVNGAIADNRFCSGAIYAPCNTQPCFDSDVCWCRCACPSSSSTGPAYFSSTGSDVVSSSSASAQIPDGTASEESSSSTAPCPSPRGEWTDWCGCSKKCGGGVQYRSCILDGKKVHDRFCEGKSYQKCNTQSCSNKRFHF